MGKPLAQSMDEAGWLTEYLNYFAEMARHIKGQIIPSDRPNENILPIFLLIKHYLILKYNLYILFFGIKRIEFITQICLHVNFTLVNHYSNPYCPIFLSIYSFITFAASSSAVQLSLATKMFGTISSIISNCLSKRSSSHEGEMILCCIRSIS